MISYQITNASIINQRQISFHSINQTKFKTKITLEPLPEIPNDMNDLDVIIYRLINQIHTASQKSSETKDKLWNTSVSRWQSLLSSKDSKNIWKAINWKGDISSISVNCPSEASFKEHFEESLGENTEDMLEVDVSQCPYIPVLDDPFVEREMQEAIQEIKANKAPDPNGISPGLPKLLPADWILRILTNFN